MQTTPQQDLQSLQPAMTQPYVPGQVQPIAGSTPIVPGQTLQGPVPGSTPSLPGQLQTMGGVSPMPSPLPQPQMSPSLNVAPQQPQQPQQQDANNTSAPSNTNTQGATPVTGTEPRPHFSAVGPAPKKDIVKKAVAKSGGSSKPSTGVTAGALNPGVASAVQNSKTSGSGPAGMKWLLDYLHKRNSDHLDHERQILQSVIDESKARNGAAPASMAGHEQDYYDQTRNTGNRL